MFALLHKSRDMIKGFTPGLSRDEKARNEGALSVLFGVADSLQGDRLTLRDTLAKEVPLTVDELLTLLPGKLNVRNPPRWVLKRRHPFRVAVRHLLRLYRLISAGTAAQELQYAAVCCSIL